MNIENIVRENIKILKPYSSARGSYSEGILLDANENALGSVSENTVLPLNRYPDPYQKMMKESVGKYLSVPADNLFFGVGSDEIIDLLIRIFCDPGIDNVIIPEPTYGMYSVSCGINNVNTVTIPLNNDWQLDLSAINKAITTNTKIIFLCSPNNPVGNILNRDDVLDLAKSFNGIVLVDEAYIEFDETKTFIKDASSLPNLVVLRTFSKAWGLAGIRCGYCIANEEIISYLMKIKAPYNINRFTSNAVVNAIKSNNKKDQFVKTILEERERVAQRLTDNSKIKKVFPSSANFLLFECDNALEVQKKLADNGIIIRDRSTQLNLADCLRVTIGSHEENDKFLTALEAIL